MLNLLAERKMTLADEQTEHIVFVKLSLFVKVRRGQFVCHAITTIGIFGVFLQLTEFLKCMSKVTNFIGIVKKGRIVWT